MNFDIFWLLSQDGFTLAAIYTLLSLGYVLIFTVTRIIFAAYGDLITVAAMTLHWMQEGRVPPTAYAVVVLALLAAAMRVWGQLRQGRAIDPATMLCRYALPREWTKHGGHAARFLFATVSRPSRTAALVTATR